VCCLTASASKRHARQAIGRACHAFSHPFVRSPPAAPLSASLGLRIQAASTSVARRHEVFALRVVGGYAAPALPLAAYRMVIASAKAPAEKKVVRRVAAPSCSAALHTPGAALPVACRRVAAVTCPNVQSCKISIILACALPAACSQKLFFGSMNSTTGW